MTDHGICVTSDKAKVKGRCMFFVVHKEQDVLRLHVRNTNEHSVDLNGYTAVPETVLTLEDDHGISTGKPFEIASGKKCEIRLRCRFPQPDVFCAMLVFQFNSKYSAFKIDCPVEVSYQSKLVVELGKYKKKKPCSKNHSHRTAQSNGLKSVIPLKTYILPADMKSVIRNLNDGGSSSEEKSLLETTLGMQEYAKRFNLLLNLEEYACMKKSLNVNEDEAQLDVRKSRLTLRIQHRAVELASTNGLEKVLFPTATSHTPNHTTPMELSLFDKTLNEEQSKAVHHIVAGSSKPAPYLVFGPPGTGKTVTLVEAIKQVEKTQASSHILACAHTNSGADLLCAMIRDPNVYRLYAKSQEGNKNPEHPLKCNWGEDGIYFPNKEELKKHKIMVTTLFTASRLVTGGIPPGFYTHIFVDEAGQPPEPEGVIPLAGLLDPERGQVVLAGDPNQSCPFISSNLAKKHGLGVSLLKRLMELNVYKKDEKKGYNDRFITKLPRSYSLHLVGKVLPFRLIFHEVTGRMQREDSTSFFNGYEVAILMRYLTELLDNVPPGDIGLIAPYRKQVEKINTAVKITFRRCMAELKVGTVEEFQGVRKRVILLSTVRSSSRGHSSFLADPKRFDMAMTRAQSLVIVAGNSQALTNNDMWHKFIEYCKENGGYTKTFQRLDI